MRKGALQNLHALCLQLADLHFLREEEETARHFSQMVRLGKRTAIFTVFPLRRRHCSASLSTAVLGIGGGDRLSSEVADFYETVHCRSKPEHPLRVAFFGRFRLQIGARELTEKDFKRESQRATEIYSGPRENPKQRTVGEHFLAGSRPQIRRNLTACGAV